jgi:phospholipid/cholesterol/gamma-HCH transport system substrate-binding protein
MKLELERWGETLLGAAVAVVAAGFFAFAAAQGGQTGAGSGGYGLTARFQRVDGINVGSEVRMYGVKVGVVRSVDIDPVTSLARLELWIDRGARVCADSKPAGAEGATGEAAPAAPAPEEACKHWRAAPVEVLDQSTAKIQSDGLLGGAHIALEQSGLTPLKPGDEILNTQPSVDFLTLLSSLAGGGKGGGDDSGGGGGGQ